MKFGTELFKTGCLVSVECSESHVLFQGIYKILLIFSDLPNTDLEKRKKFGKGSFHKNVSNDCAFRETWLSEIQTLLGDAN